MEDLTCELNRKFIGKTIFLLSNKTSNIIIEKNVTCMEIQSKLEEFQLTEAGSLRQLS